MKLYFIFFIFILAKTLDVNTFSNYQDVKLHHLNFEWKVLMNYKTIEGYAEYEFQILNQDLKEVSNYQFIPFNIKIWLDIYQIQIDSVSLSNNVRLQYEIENVQNQEEAQGSRLKIYLGESKLSSTVIIFINYTLYSKARALNFLTKKQTSSKTLPFLFSQCQFINCRSLIPLQDTPSVKFTYRAEIIVEKAYNVFLSAKKIREQQSDNENWVKHIFEMDKPIPSYLIAIVIGDLVQKQIGERTYVIAEPNEVERFSQEFVDSEMYLKTLEHYIGPYEWETYSIAVMPPSFPYAGMENTLMTFTSPTIVGGDNSGMSIIIHEMAHSWTGNTITCKNWANLWINEGFTVFIQRKADQAIFGEEYTKIDRVNWNQLMRQDIQDFGEQHSYSSLNPDTLNINPEDSLSTIPYEKGYQFVMELERMLGAKRFQEILQKLIKDYAYQSLDEEDLKLFFMQFDKNIEQVWDLWVKQPGYPPIEEKLESQRLREAQKLAEDYLNNGQGLNQSYKDFWPNQKVFFLEYLLKNKEKINHELLGKIYNDLEIDKTRNSDILSRWYEICLSVKYFENLEEIGTFLGTIGRVKRVKGIYQLLAESNIELAEKFFKDHTDFYHPVTKSVISKVLKSVVGQEQKSDL